jgi:hypothetical protein
MNFHSNARLTLRSRADLVEAVTKATGGALRA